MNILPGSDGDASRLTDTGSDGATTATRSSAMLVRIARPYALIFLAWFVSTNHVMSRHGGPDSIGTPSAGATEPPFLPAVLLMQPVYTLFYTVTLTALFTMAWMEYDEIFAASDSDDPDGADRFRRAALERCSVLADDEDFYHFVWKCALVLMFGVAFSLAFGVYLRRIDRPKTHAAMRRSVFYFCCLQLALAFTVVLSYSTSIRT